jgi:site-specific DNA-cytosine methylase
MTIQLSAESMEQVKKKRVKNIRFRKLTERECFRLMGMEDVDIDKLLASDISRSQLYHLAGNSIVVDVLTGIFRTMFIEQNAEKGQSDALF